MVNWVATHYVPHSAVNNSMYITVSLCINDLKFRSVKQLTSVLDFCCVKKGEFVSFNMAFSTG